MSVDREINFGGAFERDWAAIVGERYQELVEFEETMAMWLPFPIGSTPEAGLQMQVRNALKGLACTCWMMGKLEADRRTMARRMAKELGTDA